MENPRPPRVPGSHVPRLAHADSSFLADCLARIQITPGGLALDLPSGAGRHMALLRTSGYEVVAADLDVRLLRLVSDAAPGALRVVLDATKALPFAPGSFDLVVSIHPVIVSFLADVPGLLRPGGHLVFETFGAQGKNSRELPQAGDIAFAVVPLKPIRYLEKPTRGMPDRVTVKALFQRQAEPG
ncbi:MAG: class I SAM-dependent methyltransferase [Steroidobacteraceae bacterium]